MKDFVSTGIDKASGQRVVRLATSEHLEDRKAELAPENVHVQVYAVAPVRQPADAQGMHSRALEQARALMAKVLSGDAEKHVCAPSLLAAVMYGVAEEYLVSGCCAHARKECS